MDRDCKTLNLDQCRTRADCGTRKKPKSDELMCVKKAVRAPKLEAAPAFVRKTAVEPKAPRMTAAHKSEILEKRSKLPFGKDGSLCAGMTETDCSKAKTVCNWTKESADGKRKAHCGKREETKYESMNALRAFNARRVVSENNVKISDYVEQPLVKPKLPFSKNGSFCAGMEETDCVKSKPCQWTKESKNGKRKAHCGRRIEGKGTVFQGVGTKVGGESDPVLRLFYGY